MKKLTLYFLVTILATANIFAKPSTLAAEVSSFNPCTRKMTLYVNYFVPGLGTFGNKVEKFSGL